MRNTWTMISFVVKTRLLVCLMFILVAGFGITLLKTTKVQATHTFNTICNADTAESGSAIYSSPPVPTGNGYLYQTLEIGMGWDDFQTGHTLYGTCTLNRSNVLEYAGLFADQVWLGTEIPPDGFNAGRAPQGCVGIPPTQPGVYQCDGTGTFDFAQDDAGAITFGGNGMIYCNGIAEFCGNDIYRCGWWPSAGCPDGTPPIRGAGFADLPSPTQLGGNGTTPDALGRYLLNDIPIQMWARNTWTGGFGMRMVLTLRYPQNPPPATFIQGYKVPNDNGSVNNAIVTYVDGAGPVAKGTNTTANPYKFDLYNAEHRVNAEVNPPGYKLIGSTLCYNSTGCHGLDNNNPTSNPAFAWGNSRYVDLRANGVWGDLYWHYVKMPDPPNVSGVCSSDGNPAVEISWNDPFRPTNNYVVDISADPGFGWYWNKGVSGTLSTQATQGFSGGPMVAGNTYYARVWYPNTGGGVHSNTRPFVAPQPCGEFVLEPYTAVPTLEGSEDNPTSIVFNSSIDSAAYEPAGGVPATATREFFWKRGGVVQGPIATSTVAGYPNPPENGKFTDRTYSDRSTAVPVLQPGDEVCVKITIKPHRGLIGTNGVIIAETITEKSSEKCNTIVAKPYFRVYNGDIIAGFDVCPGWTTAATTGTIIGYNNGAGAGSGVQLAAFALKAITEFSSATGRSGAVDPPNGLSFANTIAAETYGGSFGAGGCPHNYFADEPSAPNVTAPATFAINVGALANGRTRQNAPGNLKLNPGGGAGAITVNAGEKKVLYVEGDVYIMNNVVYGYDFGGVWSSIDRIPSFTLVVKGNIYISKDVDRLDGTYVAQPNGASGGQIHSCAVTSASILVKPSVVQLINDCDDKQLTVNGAFIAKRVRLQRTIGSLKNSNNADNRNAGLPGEKFIFSPEAWLSSGIPPPTSDTKPFDSITSVPPVL